MIFKSSLSIFIKKPTGILIRVVLSQFGEFIDIMPMPMVLDQTECSKLSEMYHYLPWFPVWATD